jgi:hypothetical protein
MLADGIVVCREYEGGGRNGYEEFREPEMCHIGWDAAAGRGGAWLGGRGEAECGGDFL